MVTLTAFPLTMSEQSSVPACSKGACFTVSPLDQSLMSKFENTPKSSPSIVGAASLP